MNYLNIIGVIGDMRASNSPIFYGHHVDEELVFNNLELTIQQNRLYNSKSP